MQGTVSFLHYVQGLVSGLDESCTTSRAKAPDSRARPRGSFTLLSCAIYVGLAYRYPDLSASAESVLLLKVRSLRCSNLCPFGAVLPHTTSS
jgi:hypothetical protein